MIDNKVVARFADGKIIKGITRDFSPTKDRFHIQDTSGSADQVVVLVQELKAIFFVRDFEGDPSYNERKMYLEGEKSQGRKIEVTFTDGEVLVGSTVGYDANRPGFFLFPADSSSNNMRAYIITAAVKSVRYI